MVGDWWKYPINLYSVDQFDNEDEAFSFHIGIVIRLAEKKSYLEDDNEDIGYDAFISHASEDKESFVKPLYRVLLQKIWLPCKIRKNLHN